MEKRIIKGLRIWLWLQILSIQLAQSFESAAGVRNRIGTLGANIILLKKVYPSKKSVKKKYFGKYIALCFLLGCFLMN